MRIFGFQNLVVRDSESAIVLKNHEFSEKRIQIFEIPNLERVRSSSAELIMRRGAAFEMRSLVFGFPNPNFRDSESVNSLKNHELSEKRIHLFGLSKPGAVNIIAEIV